MDADRFVGLFTASAAWNQHGPRPGLTGRGLAVLILAAAALLAFAAVNVTMRHPDGPSLPVGWEKNQSGVGISNVRTRLQSLYGNDCQLTIRNQAPGGVEVSVSVPFRRE